MTEENNEAKLKKVLDKLTPDELTLLYNYFNSNEYSASKCRKSFSPQEDERLKLLVAKYGTDNWSAIEKEMPGRNIRQCRERYKHYLAPEVSHRPWTKEEDDLLIEKYKEIGPKWVKLKTFFDNRTDINIKNRWIRLWRKTMDGTQTSQPEPVKTAKQEKKFTPVLIPPLMNRTDILPAQSTISYPFSGNTILNLLVSKHEGNLNSR